MRRVRNARLRIALVFVVLSGQGMSTPGEALANAYEGKGPYTVSESTVPGQGLLFTPKGDERRKWPAIVFAHGLCGPAARYSDTLENLASWGFVVLANQEQEDCGEGNIRHPIESAENFFVPGGKFSQAADSGAMAVHVKNNLTYLRGRKDVDPNALALVGHSMGGGVVIDVASELAESDPGLVKAVVAIAPWNGAKPIPSSVVDRVQAPVVIFCSMSDALCPCSGPATITDTQGPITQPASVGIPILFGPGADVNWDGGAMAIYDNAANATLIEVKNVNHFVIAGTDGKQMDDLAVWARVRYGLNFNEPSRSYVRIPTLGYSVDFLYDALQLGDSKTTDIVNRARKDARIDKVLTK